jgi:hypothetical protein
MAVKWTLSAESFERLLACLDSDRERAAQRYEATRRKLAKLFAWRGCADPETLVDLTFDRVARRLDEGAEVTARDPYSFFHGVALYVLREHWRAPVQKERPLPAGGDRRAAPLAAPEESSPRLECLDECVRGLGPENRKLIVTYHEGRGGERIRARAALAASLGVSATALRLRAFRLRAGLETCVHACEERRKSKQNGPAAHQPGEDGRTS